MIALIRNAIFLLALLTAHSKANGVVQLDQGFNAYAAAGIAFTPGSFRVGYNAWEGGVISPGFLGLVKNFRWGQSTYSSFGFGFNAEGFDVRPGFQAGAGFDFELFWGLGLRGELMGRANFNGNVIGSGLLGISYDF